MLSLDVLQPLCCESNSKSVIILCSVCPPYLKVSYEELFGLLEKSPLLHKETFVVVEYPAKTKFKLPETVGPLPLLKDRKFGRTRLALFGPE